MSPEKPDLEKSEKRPGQIEGMNPRVLYAEDDIHLQEVTSMWLKRWGGKVTAVESGEELLDKFNKGQFDIIVTDNNMGGITGSNVLKTIRGEGNNIPIIVLTYDHIQEEVENLGGIFMSKNTPIKNLHTVIEEVLKEDDKLK